MLGWFWIKFGVCGWCGQCSPSLFVVVCVLWVSFWLFICSRRMIQTFVMISLLLFIIIQRFHLFGPPLCLLAISSCFFLLWSPDRLCRSASAFGFRYSTRLPCHGELREVMLSQKCQQWGYETRSMHLPGRFRVGRTLQLFLGSWVARRMIQVIGDLLAA